MWRSMDCLLPILVITMQKTSERVCHSSLSLNSHSTQAIEEGKDHPERSFVWTKRGRGGAPTEAACGDEDHFQKPCMYSSQYMQFSRILRLFCSTAISKRPRLSRKAFLLEDDMDHDREGSQEERRCGLVPYNDVWVHHAEHMCM